MKDKSLGSTQIVHVVMTIDSSAWVPCSCIGAFHSFEAALDYARETAVVSWREEGCCVTDEDLMREDDGQYTMSLEHDDSDFKVVIDTAVPRDFNLVKL